MTKLQVAVKQVLGSYSQKKGKVRTWGWRLAISGLVLEGLAFWGMSISPEIYSQGPIDACFIAMSHIGPMMLVIGLACLVIKGKKQRTISRWHRAHLLSMAKKLENKISISGTDYGKFLIISHRGALFWDEKEQITNALKELVIKKGRRISGHDYIELEKTLAGAGKKATTHAWGLALTPSGITLSCIGILGAIFLDAGGGLWWFMSMFLVGGIVSYIGSECLEADDENLDIFSSVQKEVILEDYEKLREEIRDRSLIGS